ncbi:MAG: hypothetical protein GY863_11890 [bacterium]|nr:hypothetical protein [bacterium]
MHKYAVIAFLLSILFSFTLCSTVSERYMSISELHGYCDVPGEPGEALECEGESVKVRGYIDHGNVFNKTDYPQLPYEKFIIADLENKNRIEVWTVSDDNSKIYKKIADSKSEEKIMIYVEAKIEGVDLYTGTSGERWIKLTIESENNISFER